jgi:hypothetical protein
MRLFCTSRRCAAFALATVRALALGAILAPASAQDRFERDGPSSPPPFSGRESRGLGSPGFFRGYDGPTEATIKDRGFLFLDGEYLAPPYEIRYAEDKLTANGRELTCIPPPRNIGGRGFGYSRGGEPSWRYMVNELSSHLEQNAVVFSFEGQPYYNLDVNKTYEFLGSIMAQEKRSVRQAVVREGLPTEFDKTVWDNWIAHFEPPEDLRQRAAVFVSRYDEDQRKAEAQIRAAQWMERLAYPLSVGSMVLIVLAIGHLLGGRPHAGKPSFGVDASPELIRALEWSLFFTMAFSSIDLIWTILAANSNQMRELNPIGSQWIEDSRHLAGFKISVTFSCLALLWLLRRHKRAQIAAWWVCLILTLVTIRWLTFHSLFVAG